MEHLKLIPGFIGYYADKKGNIYSSWTTRGIKIGKRKKLSPVTMSNGYLFLRLRIAPRIYYSTGVHRLICLAFYGIPKKNFTASHLDGNRKNNKLENLIWETLSDNHKRKIEHGTDDRGYHNSRAKINKETLYKIRALLREGNYTHKKIGEMFNLNRVFITKINNNYRYNNII